MTQDHPALSLATKKQSRCWLVLATLSIATIVIALLGSAYNRSAGQTDASAHVHTPKPIIVWTEDELERLHILKQARQEARVSAMACSAGLQVVLARVDFLQPDDEQKRQAIVRLLDGVERKLSFAIIGRNDNWQNHFHQALDHVEMLSAIRSEEELNPKKKRSLLSVIVVAAGILLWLHFLATNRPY